VLEPPHDAYSDYRTNTPGSDLERIASRPILLEIAVRHMEERACLRHRRQWEKCGTPRVCRAWALGRMGRGRPECLAKRPDAPAAPLMGGRPGQACDPLTGGLFSAFKHPKRYSVLPY